MEAKESQGTACITESPGSHSQDIKPGFEGSEEVTRFKHSTWTHILLFKSKFYLGRYFYRNLLKVKVSLAKW